MSMRIMNDEMRFGGGKWWKIAEFTKFTSYMKSICISNIEHVRD